jgi:phosphatidate cytidylyltransferase
MLKLRVTTAVVLLAILLGALAWSPLAFDLVAAVLIGAAVFEWLRLAGWRAPAPLVGGILVAGVLLAAAWRGWLLPRGAVTGIFALAFLVWIVLAIGLWRAEHRGMRLGRTSITALCFVTLIPAWLGLSELQHRGPVTLISALAVVWAADIAAYFVGRAFGRAKLAPHISPGKTWAGVWGGMGAVLLLAGAVALAWPDGRIFSTYLWQRYTWPVALVMLAALVVMSIVGDLFESWLKRQAGVKDSSRLLPGHGGVLDRVDALVPVLPAAALLMRWVP